MFGAFLHRLPQKIVGCYAGYRWAWHVAAALITAALVWGGFDWLFFEHTRSDALDWLIFTAGIGGFFIPIVVSVGLYWAGEWRKSAQRMRAGAAVMQASLIALLITTFYKIITGRTQPEFLTTLNTTDLSHDFHFGFFQNGVFWGWPSSHAAVTVAGATALFLLWPNRAVRAGCIVWAVVVCVGAAVGFHWFSDVVAGVIVGALAGAAVWEDASDTIHSAYKKTPNSLGVDGASAKNQV